MYSHQFNTYWINLFGLLYTLMLLLGCPKKNEIKKEDYISKDNKLIISDIAVKDVTPTSELSKNIIETSVKTWIKQKLKKVNHIIIQQDNNISKFDTYKIKIDEIYLNNLIYISVCHSKRD